MADGGNFMHLFSTVAMNVIIIDDDKDRKGSEMNTALTFVLDFNHCYPQKSKTELRPLSAVYALDCWCNTLMRT